MASDGGHGPKPYVQRQARTVFVRVPAVDWPAVKRGLKTEFRGAPGAVSGMKWVECPTPVVAYRQKHGIRDYESALMVLEETWKEPLGAISEESLAREGFENLAQFRRYWTQRNKRGFRPLHEVTVYRVRVWRPDDMGEFAERIFRHLYEAFLPST